MRVGDLIDKLHKFGMNDEVVVPAGPASAGQLTDKIIIQSGLKNHERYIVVLPHQGIWAECTWEFKDD